MKSVCIWNECERKDSVDMLMDVNLSVVIILNPIYHSL